MGWLPAVPPDLALIIVSLVGVDALETAVTGTRTAADIIGLCRGHHYCRASRSACSRAFRSRTFLQKSQLQWSVDCSFIRVWIVSVDLALSESGVKINVAISNQFKAFKKRYNQTSRHLPAAMAISAAQRCRAGRCSSVSLSMTKPGTARGLGNFELFRAEMVIVHYLQVLGSAVWERPSGNGSSPPHSFSNAFVSVALMDIRRSFARSCNGEGIRTVTCENSLPSVVI